MNRPSLDARAAVAERDPSMANDRNDVALNLAIIYQRIGKNLEAIGLLRRYLGWKPDDIEARKSLAIAFRNAGMADSAQAVETALNVRLARSNLDSLDTADLMSVGVAAFNNQKYLEAATAFAKAVQRNPWSRDARYNLTNTYLAMKDNEHLIAEATKLLEIEPLSEDALRLLAQGQRALRQTDALLKTAERLVGLPVSLEVTAFQLGQSSARLSLQATGRSPQDAAGKPLRVRPVTLVVEFLNLSGAVIDSKEVAIPVLTTGQKQSFQLEGQGSGIVGWRYRPKPS